MLDCDVEFELNPPENMLSDPDSYAWFPRPEQEELYNTGFADDSFIRPYQLGFIAAVTIECDDVVFDLNGHTLEQSNVFYLQQRFSACSCSTTIISSRAKTRLLQGGHDHARCSMW